MGLIRVRVNPVQSFGRFRLIFGYIGIMENRVETNI